MEENEREVWIGKHRVYIREDNIIHITAVGDIDEKVTREIKKLATKLLERIEKINLLIDLNKAGKATLEARKFFKEMARDERIGLVATFGLHPVARVIATFGMGVVHRRGTSRFFKTEEEALAWLKE